MSRYIICATLVAGLVFPATAQIATSNEDGATGAYSSEIDSSFTTETRFGPRTAIDDLRADVDRDREQIEKLRQRQLRLNDASPPRIEPLRPSEITTEAEDSNTVTPETN